MLGFIRKSWYGVGWCSSVRVDQNLLKVHVKSCKHSDRNDRNQKTWRIFARSPTKLHFKWVVLRYSSWIRSKFSIVIWWKVRWPKLSYRCWPGTVLLIWHIHCKLRIIAWGSWDGGMVANNRMGREQTLPIFLTGGCWKWTISLCFLISLIFFLQISALLSFSSALSSCSDF